MPQEFDECIRTPGSRKVTKSLPGGHYVHGCKKPGSDKWVWGERKTKLKKGKTAATRH